MARSVYKQNSFVSGVLEPRLKGRIDIQQYYQSMQQGDNILVLPQGGVRHRYGMVYMDQIGIDDDNVRMFEFAIEADRVYLCVFTNGRLRFYRDGAFVYELQAGDISVPATLYLDADVPFLNGAQIEKVMVIVQENYPPQRLVNLGSDTDWLLDVVPFSAVPQFDYNDANSPTPVTDQQTFTFVNFNEGDRFQIAIDNINTGDIHYSDDSVTTANNMVTELLNHPVIGNSGVTVTGTLPDLVLQLSGPSADAYDKHIAWATGTIDSSTNNEITVVHDVVGSPRKEDIWSSLRGYPRTITFYQGRMWLGGTTSKPQSLFASKSGDFFNFDLSEQLDDDAIFITIATRTLNEITNLIAGRTLQVFTAGGEFSLQNDIPTPSNAAINSETNHGTSRINPVEIDGSTLFVERTGKTVREYIFTFQEASYTAENISVLAQHLIGEPVSMDAQKGTRSDDANYVFIVNDDGSVAVINTLREQQIRAFTRMTTDGNLLDVCVSDDVVYMSVQRVINGNTNIYLERLTFDTPLDSTLIYDGAPTDTITGLDHLEGKTVKVIADGAVLRDKVVASGSITLERTTEYAQVGLWSPPLIQPMPLVGENRSGTNEMRYKSVVRSSLRVHETVALNFDGVTVPRRQFQPAINSPLDTPPQPFTGVIPDLECNLGWIQDAAPIITQESPGPLTLLAITFELEAR